MVLEHEVVPGKEIKRVADALREVDKKAPAQLRKELRGIATTGAKVVKGKARTLPAKGTRGGTAKHPHKRRQMRRTLARGVKVQASTGGRKGAALRIVTQMPDRRAALLPRAFDLLDTWSHPTFKTGPKVSQQGGFDWFVAPLGEMQPESQAAVRQVLEDAKEKIRAAGA